MSDTTFDLRIVHPLDDEPEAKLYRPDLGRMRMTRGVRVSLLLLRFYLILMLLLVAVRVAGGV
jgi:hypothetical protein